MYSLVSKKDNIFILSFFLFSFSFSSAQYDKLKVSYIMSYVDETSSKQITQDFQISFKLLVDDTKSYFTYDLTKTPENEDFRFANRLAAQHEYFYKNDTLYAKTFSRRTNEHSIFLVDENKYNWTITDESRTVAGFVCYKAFALRNFYSSITDKHFTRSYEVWFAPSLADKKGPSEFVNLPGLVLYVKGGGFVMNAISVEFKDNIELPTLNYDVVMSESEYISKKVESFKQFIKQ